MANVHDHAVRPAMDIDISHDHDHSKSEFQLKEVEHVNLSAQNPVFNESEPELHARTWIALEAFFLLNYTQVVALQSPAAVVSICLVT